MRKVLKSRIKFLLGLYMHKADKNFDFTHVDLFDRDFSRRHAESSIPYDADSARSLNQGCNGHCAVHYKYKGRKDGVLEKDLDPEPSRSPRHEPPRAHV